MLAAVKGYYEKGKVTLSENPPIGTKTEVIVTFLESEAVQDLIGRRKLGGLEGKVNLPDDFNEPLDDLKDYM